MARYRFTAYKNDSQPRYIALYDMQHQVIEVQRLDPASDLSGAMAATIERLAADGWQAEGTADYGSVFVHRGGERRLLMLTQRDPYDTAVQSFSPFRRA
jgi:hypothetical protein